MDAFTDIFNLFGPSETVRDAKADDPVDTSPVDYDDGRLPCSGCIIC